MYHVTPLREQMHLDASLQGLGGQFKNYVFSLPIPLNFMHNIAHLEKVNVIVTLTIWDQLWANKRTEIFCDIKYVVDVLSSYTAEDQILATSARNVWLSSALYNISIVVSHVRGSQNKVADLLPRWCNLPEDYSKLLQSVEDPIWLSTLGRCHLGCHLIQWQFHSVFLVVNVIGHL